MLASRMRAAIPDFAPRFLIDTGRNGVDSAIRQSCSNWCNIRGAGLGREPTAATELPGLVDVRRVHCEHALAQSHGRDRELTRSDRERAAVAPSDACTSRLRLNALLPALRHPFG